MVQSSTFWQALGAVSPLELVEPRLLLHYAAQLAACSAQSLLPKRGDDGQMALSWKDGALVGEPLSDGARVGLRLASLTLEIRDARGGLSTSFPLMGHTTLEALAWLRVRLGEGGVDTAGLRVQMPYALPPHPVGEGSPFLSNRSDALTELTRIYADAAFLLSRWAAQENASPLRCWPHHFDLAVLLSIGGAGGVGGGGDPEQSKSINVGLSPGDETYSEPYFYVSPWPYPAIKALPGLRIGHWHTAPWVGAVLTFSELLSGPVGTQENRAEGFLVTAVEACEALLA